MTEITPAMTASIRPRACAAQSGLGLFATSPSVHQHGGSWRGISTYTSAAAADQVKAAAGQALAGHVLTARAPMNPVSTKRQIVKKNGTNGSPHWRIPV